MIPEKLFNDLLKDKDVPDSLTSHLKLQKKLCRALGKKRLVDTFPGVAERYTYTLKNGPIDNLPGELVRLEEQDPTGDPAVDECHYHHGLVRQFLKECLGRDSFDGAGGDLHGSVHVEEGFDNAFWNSAQMAYGDGLIFQRFTKSLDVAAHEIAHGITERTSNLTYWSMPGALNESFSDVVGVACKQWAGKQTSKDGNWLIGDDLVTDKFPGKAIRSFKDEKAYSSDSQPKHMKKYSWTFEDNQGVHINSGIPNHMFYQFCLNCSELGITESYKEPVRLWYRAYQMLHSWSNFWDLKKALLKVAKSEYPLLLPALQESIKKVGL